MVSKRSDSSSIYIREKLQVEKSASAAGPASKNALPASLLLVTMGKHDMCMGKRRVVMLREFFEAEDIG
jgi:hypothetical protein